MKMSIRYKLLLYMLASVALFAGLLFIANQYLVEDYYLDKNKNELRKTSQMVLELIDRMDYNREEETLTLNEKDVQELIKIQRQRGLDISISNNFGYQFYPFNSMVSLMETRKTEEAVSGDAPDAKYSVNKEAQNLDAKQHDSIDHTKEYKPGSTTNGAESEQNSNHLENDMYSDRINKIHNTSTSITTIYDNVIGASKSSSSNGNSASVNIQDYIYRMPSIAITSGSGGNTYEIISKEKDGSFYAFAQDDYIKLSYLQYQTTHENGLILSISMSMSIISEGVEISNRFTTIIGLITIIFTIIWALFVSHKFTKPIKEININTNRMTNLDFSHQLEIKGNDEVAQLSANINTLSHKLDETIGELNQKNRKLAEDIDKERKIDKMRRDFISNVSHELKTPIFLIQGYADGLKSNITRNQQKKDFYCDVIIDEADKMNILVKELLVLARMESGQTEIEQTEFNLYELIMSIIEKYRITFEENLIDLILPEESTLMVYADAFKIEQVITNYINNALEYVDEKRQIEITIAPPCADNEFPASDDKVHVCVFNTGKHLKKEEQEMVWNNFYKADQARSREIGGAGLGLSIVKAIMEAHKCSYGVCNRPDGIAFWFEVMRAL